MVRTFDTGASRDDEEGKLDYEGFLSPLVLDSFATYMDEKRRMPDGSLRASDNWQKGMPLDVYMKSMWRHFFALWSTHRGWGDGDRVELCNAILFNVQGYAHELLTGDATQYDRDPYGDRDIYSEWTDQSIGMCVGYPPPSPYASMGDDPLDPQEPPKGYVWDPDDWDLELDDEYVQAPLPSLEEEEAILQPTPPPISEDFTSEVEEILEQRREHYQRSLYKCGDPGCQCAEREVTVKPKPVHNVQIGHTPQSHGTDFWAANACDHEVCVGVRKAALGC